MSGPEGSGSSPQATPEIRVLIVDDHQLFASSLAATLGAESDIVIVGVANDIAGAEGSLASAKPDVVLLDHRLPDGDGVAAVGRLSQRYQPAQFVILTASTAEHVLIAAIEAGVAGFVSKTRSLADLTAAVRAAAAGEAVISPELLARLLPRLRRGGTGTTTKLTQREVEVLQLVARGMSNAAIAAELVVSVHTVRNHVANLSAKLAAHSKLEAVSIGLREGIISVP